MGRKRQLAPTPGGGRRDQVPSPRVERGFRGEVKHPSGEKGRQFWFVYGEKIRAQQAAPLQCVLPGGKA